jgi:hypothetical protein
MCIPLSNRCFLQDEIALALVLGCTWAGCWVERVFKDENCCSRVCTALLQRFLRYSPQKGGVKVLHSESYCFWWCAVWLVSALGICVLWWWSQLFSLVDLLQKDAFTSEFDRRSSYFVRTDGVLIAVVLAERFDAEWCICIRIWHKQPLFWSKHRDMLPIDIVFWRSWLSMLPSSLLYLPSSEDFWAGRICLKLFETDCSTRILRWPQYVEFLHWFIARSSFDNP